MQYLKDYQTFVGTARYWTEAFAKASSLGIDEKVCEFLFVFLSLREMISLWINHVKKGHFHFFKFQSCSILQVQKLVEMGFPEDIVRSTLEAVGGDENLALEKLCSA